MKKHLNLFIMMAMAMLLSIGCAKKPSQDQAPAVEAPAAQQQQQNTNTITKTDVVEPVKATIADLTRVYFEFDSYVLTGEARTTLQQNATVLRNAPYLKVQVDGHCDERGSDDYNLALGERRAQATVDYLVSLGVDGSQLTTNSYGEMMPLDPGHDESAWSKNRRAEFVKQ